jgi:hypothetical protein
MMARHRDRLSPESADAPDSEAEDVDHKAEFDQLWEQSVPVEETLERLRKRIDAAP